MTKKFATVATFVLLLSAFLTYCATTKQSESDANKQRPSQQAVKTQETAAQPQQEEQASEQDATTNKQTETDSQQSTQPNKQIECQTDADCVPATCCHPHACVPKQQAPNCRGVICTMDCRGPIDCGRGKCVCNNGKCEVYTTFKGYGPIQ